MNLASIDIYIYIYNFVFSSAKKHLVIGLTIKHVSNEVITFFYRIFVCILRYFLYEVSCCRETCNREVASCLIMNVAVKIDLNCYI